METDHPVERDTTGSVLTYAQNIFPYPKMMSCQSRGKSVIKYYFTHFFRGGGEIFLIFTFSPFLSHI